MLLREIINQNYSQFDKNYYKGNTGITMGSPIAGIAAKIFLQYLKTYHQNNGWKQEKLYTIINT
jgi:hypothetical protein